MAKKNLWTLASVVLMLLLTLPVLAQESAVKGNLGGVVLDATGAVITGAKVTMSGAIGTRSDQTDKDGHFLFPNLIPGFYDVKVEKDGFKAAEVKAAEVVTGKTATVSVTMQPGAVTETVEVSASAVAVDTTSTAISTNLTDQFYEMVPSQRNVAQLFYTAPGVVSGGATGISNPSISGGSGLENTYIADGVNITDSAFGGLGTYTRNQGSIGTGINLSFIKEVQVKTSGFEPQYGQSTGGIVQIVTKSGSNAYHGALSAYMAPIQTKATPAQRDAVRVNRIGTLWGSSDYDVSGELGGYVPKMKDHLFFFGSVDPTWDKTFRNPPPTSGLAKIFPSVNYRTKTYNYDGKLTWKINDSHQVEGSVFGDPSHTNNAKWTGLASGGGPGIASLNAANATGFSHIDYGTRSVVARYNGAMSPTWLVNGSFNWNINDSIEAPAADVWQIVDRTGSVTNTLQGFGFLENHRAHTYSFTLDTSKVVNAAGQHTLMVGYHYENPTYIDIKSRSGPRFTVPAVNRDGGSYLPTKNSPAGHQSDVQFGLVQDTGGTCTLCPLYPTGGNGALVPVYLTMTRGEFGAGGKIPTYSKYMAGYVNDSWEINKHVTLNAGARWEQHLFSGNVASQKYTFTDNWLPRIGLAIDPKGDRKTKIFFNFGRYDYMMPLDAAIRQLSEELDLLNVAFLPVISGKTVTAVPDQAHVLNNAAGGIPGNAKVTVAGLGEAIAPGTKMEYNDEYVFGVEHEYKGWVISARYVDRRLRRTIEDVGSVSPEGNNVLSQNSFIANPSPSLDLFVNEVQTPIPAGVTLPAAKYPGCDSTNTGPVSSAGVTLGNSADASGNVFTPNSICFKPSASAPAGAVAGDVGADGIPDGFINPQRIYRAGEFEVSKAFSHNYMVRTNFRLGHLYGNYEGAFRNDNGQQDPGISSLFDFTAGQYNLLGDQFAIGDLNTDRRYVLNGFFSYTLDRSKLKGMELGTSVHISSGTPLNNLGNHPAYNNQGEVPIGGRGALGRTPVSGGVDFKMDYPFKVTEKSTLKLGADLFNLANSKTVLFIDQNNALSAQPVGSNLDFKKPVYFQAPFYARFSVRWEF